MIFLRKFLKIGIVLILFLTLLQLVHIFTLKSRINETVQSKLRIEKNVKVSWEDKFFQNYEKTRVGPGEHGAAVIVNDTEELKKNEEWVVKEGFYVEVSNKISLTRALPDRRPKV